MYFTYPNKFTNWNDVFFSCPVRISEGQLYLVSLTLEAAAGYLSCKTLVYLSPFNSNTNNDQTV